MAVTYQEILSPVQSFLVLALQDINSHTEQEERHLGALYEQIGDEEAWQSATDNKVLPHVAHTLQEISGNRHAPQRWMRVHEQYKRRNLCFIDELDQLAGVLAETHNPAVLVEAGSILYGVYPCKGCFSSDDIDLLVDATQRQKIHQVLVAAGFETGVQQWSVPSSRQAYCKPVSADSVLWLNVMFEPLSRRWVAPVEALDCQEILARAQRVSDHEAGLLLPATEDHVLLCALHASVHGYVRPPGLRLYVDVDRVVRYRPLNWDLVLERANAWQVKRRVFIALAIATGLLNTPIPEAVLDDLVPNQEEQQRLLTPLAQKSVFHTGKDKFSRLEFARFEAQLDDRGIAHGVLRGIFPSSTWMRKRYAIARRWQLPIYYVRRLGAIVRRWHPAD